MPAQMRSIESLKRLLALIFDFGDVIAQIIEKQEFGLKEGMSLLGLLPQVILTSAHIKDLSAEYLDLNESETEELYDFCLSHLESSNPDADDVREALDVIMGAFAALLKLKIKHDIKARLAAASAEPKKEG